MARKYPQCAALVALVQKYIVIKRNYGIAGNIKCLKEAINQSNINICKLKQCLPDPYLKKLCDEAIKQLTIIQQNCNNNSYAQINKLDGQLAIAIQKYFNGCGC